MVQDVNIINVKGQEGPASETTLKQLVQALRGKSFDYEKTLSGIQNQIGKGNKSIASAAALLDKSLLKFNQIPNNINNFSNFLDSGVNAPLQTLGTTVTDTANIITNKFTKYFPGLGKYLEPLVGVGGGLLGMFAAYMQNTVDAFNELSKVGAGFGGDLLEIRRAAANGMMSLDEFSHLVMNNSKTLSMFGNGVSSGAKNFARLSKEVQQFDNYRLRELGFSFQDVNETLMEYLELNGMNVLNQGVDKTAKNAVAFGEQLNQLSAVSGKTRKEIAQLANAEMNRGESLALQINAGKGVVESMSKMQTSLSIFGPTVQRAATGLQLYGTYVNEESRTLLRMAPNMNRVVRSMAAAAKAGDEASENYDPEKMYDAMAADSNRLKFLASRGNKEAQRLLEEFGKTNLRLSGMSETARKNYWITQRLENENRNKFSKGFLKVGDTFRAVRAVAERAFLKEGGMFDRFTNAVGGFLSKFQPGEIERFMETAVAWLENTFSSAESSLIQFKDWITGVIKGDISLDDAWEDIKTFMERSWDSIKGTALDLIKIGVEEIGNVIQPIWEEQVKDAIAYFKDALTGMVQWTGWYVKQLLPGWLGGGGGPEPSMGREYRDALAGQRALDKSRGLPFVGEFDGGGFVPETGIAKVHKNEWVAKPGLGEFLGSGMQSLIAALSETNSRDSKGTRELAPTDYSRVERDQFAINAETRDLIRELVKLNDRANERFEYQVAIIEQMGRDIGDQLDAIENKNRT